MRRCSLPPAALGKPYEQRVHAAVPEVGQMDSLRQ